MVDTIMKSRLDTIEKSINDIKEILGDLVTNYHKPTTGYEILNVEQCAQLTGLSISTIYKHCHHKLLPFYKAGKFLRFKRTEIEDWLTSNRRRTLAEIEIEVNMIANNLKTKK